MAQPQDQARLEEFMAASNLEHLLFAVQSTKGVRNVRELGRLSEKDLDECGFREMHKRRLGQALRDYRGPLNSTGLLKKLSNDQPWNPGARNPMYCSVAERQEAVARTEAARNTAAAESAGLNIRVTPGQPQMPAFAALQPPPAPEPPREDPTAAVYSNVRTGPAEALAMLTPKVPGAPEVATAPPSEDVGPEPLALPTNTEPTPGRYGRYHQKPPTKKDTRAVLSEDDLSFAPAALSSAPQAAPTAVAPPPSELNVNPLVPFAQMSGPSVRLSGAHMGQHGLGPGMMGHGDISAPGNGGLGDAELEEMVSKVKSVGQTLSKGRHPPNMKTTWDTLEADLLPGPQLAARREAEWAAYAAEQQSGVSTQGVLTSNTIKDISASLQDVNPLHKKRVVARQALRSDIPSNYTAQQYLQAEWQADKLEGVLTHCEPTDVEKAMEYLRSGDLFERQIERNESLHNAVDSTKEQFAEKLEHAYRHARWSRWKRHLFDRTNWEARKTVLYELMLEPWEISRACLKCLTAQSAVQWLVICLFIVPALFYGLTNDLGNSYVFEWRPEAITQRAPHVPWYMQLGFPCMYNCTPPEPVEELWWGLNATAAAEWGLNIGSNNAGGKRPCPGRGGTCEGSKPTTCAPMCQQHGTCNEEIAACYCPVNKRGADCSTNKARSSKMGKFPGFQSDAFCLSDCSRRGQCLGGFCHCFPGFYGQDCSLQIDKESGVTRLSDWHPDMKDIPRPRIYVYDLPPEYSAWFDIKAIDEPLEQVFAERLMSSAHRTVNPDQADFFFVPVPTQSYIKMGPERAQEAFEKLTEYIRGTWPYWDRTHAMNHVMVMGGKWGACEAFGGKVPASLQDAIFLTLFGLHEQPPQGHYTHASAACHKPGKDIVLPPLLSLPPLRNSPFFPDGLAIVHEFVHPNLGHPYRHSRPPPPPALPPLTVFAPWPPFMIPSPPNLPPKRYAKGQWTNPKGWKAKHLPPSPHPPFPAIPANSMVPQRIARSPPPNSPPHPKFPSAPAEEFLLAMNPFRTDYSKSKGGMGRRLLDSPRLESLLSGRGMGRRLLDSPRLESLESGRGTLSGRRLLDSPRLESLESGRGTLSAWMDDILPGISPPPPAYVPVQDNRTITFLYGSGGWLQDQIFTRHRDRPGFQRHKNPHDLEEAMGDARFCLSAREDGASSMTVKAAVYGCIPVIMQDGIHQPFEDVLPYVNFAVRIAETDIDTLPDILTAVALDKQRLSRMQDELACAIPHFLYSSVYGSIFGEGAEQDAFATTMWLLDHKRIKREGILDSQELPIHSVCYNNLVRDEVRGAEMFRQRAPPPYIDNTVRNLFDKWRADREGKLSYPPPVPPPPRPPQPSPPPPANVQGRHGLCRYPCGGIPQERMTRTKHQPWPARGAACHDKIPC